MKRLRYGRRRSTPSTLPSFRRWPRDARTSVADIARLTVGMSAPSIADRMKRLEESGVIEGYTVRIDAPRDRTADRAWLRVRPLPGELRSRRDSARTSPEIVECDRVTGEDCFIAKAHVRSVEHLEDHRPDHSVCDDQHVNHPVLARRTAPARLRAGRRKRSRKKKAPANRGFLIFQGLSALARQLRHQAALGAVLAASASLRPSRGRLLGGRSLPAACVGTSSLAALPSSACTGSSSASDSSFRPVSPLFLGLDGDAHRAALLQLAEQHLVGQRLLDVLLDDAAERPRAHALVIALLGQPGDRFRRQVEGDAALGKLRLELHDELLHDLVDDRHRQRARTG